MTGFEPMSSRDISHFIPSEMSTLVFYPEVVIALATLLTVSVIAINLE